MAKITVEWDTKVIEHHRVTVDSEGLPDHVLRALTDTSGDFEGDLEEFLADQEGEETLASSIVEDRCFDEATDE